MPGFLGGSSSTSSGQVTIYPNATLLDPVSKLRVSEPQTMMDTDFEYGLQPTKWETVELINNTPSFFSASGDTTLPNLNDMTTTAGSREIKVTTLLPHGASVGIPINVTGSKSLTADGSYIINSVPDSTTFTYLCKSNQLTTASIIDLYTSIITGQFFQGSQIKISDSQGLVTDAATASTLTITTDSPHGFGVNTPFYFLNLNSTVSQEFDASNSGAKTFDSSNTATAQTFDGSNTLTTYQADLNNKATLGGTVSNIVTVNTTTDTITVTHTTENFSTLVVGAPLYYNVAAASGFFATTPRGVVFLATVDQVGTSASTFQISATPGGSPIDITVTLTGTFQSANNATTFPGNNTNVTTPFTINVFQNTALGFDGSNTSGKTATVNSYSGSSILVTNNEGSTSALGWVIGTMVLYTGNAAGLTTATTYWISNVTVLSPAAPGLIQVQLAATPGGTSITTTTSGTGTHTIKAIGVSIDKDIFYIPTHGLARGDMIRYVYPAGGAFTTSTTPSDYYFVDSVVDANNIKIGNTKGAGGLTQLGSRTFQYTTAPVYDISTIITDIGTAGMAQLPSTGVFYLKYDIYVRGGGTSTITVACRKDTANNRISQSAFSMLGGAWSYTTGTSSLFASGTNTPDDHDTYVMLGDGTFVINFDNVNSWASGSSSNWGRSRALSEINGRGTAFDTCVPYSQAASVSGSATLIACTKTNSNIILDMGNSRIRVNDSSWSSYDGNMSSVIGTGGSVNSIMTLSDGVNGFLCYRWGAGTAIEVRMNMVTGAILSTRTFGFSNTQNNPTEEDAFGTTLHAVDGGFSYLESTTFYVRDTPWTAASSYASGSVVTSGSAGGGNTQTDMDIFYSIDPDRYIWFGDWGHDDGGLYQIGNDSQLNVRKTNIYHVADNYVV